MLELNIPAQHRERVQEVMGTLSHEVNSDNFGQVLSDYLEAASYGANGKLHIQTVTLGKDGNTVSELNTREVGLVKSVLVRENTALLLYNDAGAVFCLNYVQVDDKEYLQFLNPDAAMTIRNELQEMVDDPQHRPEALSLWDMICDFFARLFQKHPGEAAARVEAYQNFYANMQKGLEKVGALAQEAHDRRPVVNAPTEVEHIEIETNENQQIEEQPLVNEPVVSQPDDNNVQNEHNPLEASIIDEDVQQENIEEEPVDDIKAALERQREQRRLEEEKRLAEELERQKQLKLEQERKAEEARQQREAELNAIWGRIKVQQNIVEECKQALAKLEPEYEQLQAYCKEANAKLNVLKHHEVHGAKEKCDMLNLKEKKEEELEAVEDKIKANEKKKDFDVRKEKAKALLDKREKAWLDAKKALEEIEGDLRSAQLEFAYVGAIGKDNGTWSSAKAVLEQQYRHEKAIGDERFAQAQQKRDEKIKEQEDLINVHKIRIKKFTDERGFFSRTSEEREQLGEMENDLSEAKKVLKQLKKENQQAQKDYENEDRAKQKELLNPTKERLEEVDKELSQVKAHYKDVMKKHDSIASRYDLLKGSVPDLEAAYKKQLRIYNNKYIENPDRYDPALHESLTKEKNGLENHIKLLDRKIEEHDAMTQNLPNLWLDISRPLLPKEARRDKVQSEIRLTKGKMERAQEAIEKEEALLKGDKKLDDPNKQSGGLGMG